MAPRSSRPRPILCAVLDAAALGTNPTDAALALFRAGVDWIQLRDRSLGANALLRLVGALVEARDLAGRSAADPYRVIVNRRIDIVISAAPISASTRSPRRRPPVCCRRTR